jgi:acyl-CoA reductase-like NAD-dependent aldehyde dehydrogenase
MSNLHDMPRPPSADAVDDALRTLANNKHRWARTSAAERVDMLRRMKETLMPQARAWVSTAAEQKGIPADSPLVGEEWLAGPYACMSALNLYIETVGAQPGKAYLAQLAQRELPGGQLAVQVFPHTLIERILAGGVKAEVWMEPGVTASNLARNTAGAYSQPDAARSGKVTLVLGAGNVAAIAPLDVLYKLLVQHEVCIVKLNPVNDYLLPFFSALLQPAIDLGVVRLFKGGADVGAYLAEHPLVETIHITGSEAVHDAIVWGVGEEARHRKANRSPRNTRPIHSELGAITPAIVVPGPWSEADLRFQAEALVTQKLQNNGFNCAASQVMLLSSGWDLAPRFEQLVKQVLRDAPQRAPYYPGADRRVGDVKRRYVQAEVLSARSAASERVFLVLDPDTPDRHFFHNEVFGAALARVALAPADPETFLRMAIAYANTQLRGSLSANIIIHPETLRALGQTFDTLLLELRYGAIGVNVWAAYSFLLATATWGAFPGHPLDDVQSGRGVVHNAFMFDKPERTVVRGPFRAFPKPPWFVTNRKADQLGPKLTALEYRPGLLKLPGILLASLGG